ncbi:flavodoxin FldB [Moritella sp. 5]|uniref:flavodoxin FldB n=1 Tax=Moritella sp. 5 TaxID=2746231 RepID=UPI001BAA7588|nr:flavodoxin FldB [Moritella sp. 5]QUM82418.1 flavodoxin FldB [Moritella sp. 5]
MKIGLYYGSTTFYTTIAAEKIQAEIGAELVDLHDIKDSGFTDIETYDVVLFGISTWDYGELQEDWGDLWSDIAGISLAGKTVALFGLGDQVNYSEWFLDAMGMLFDELQGKGINFIGQWPNKGYEFVASKALTEDESQFLGLALDEDSQYDLTDERIATWTLQVLEEIEAHYS